MFEDLLRELKQLERGLTITVSVPVDENGFIDKECPSQDCLFVFKVHQEDWANICRDEEIFCPQCGHSAHAKSWFTTEQVKYLEERAGNEVQHRIQRGLSRSAQRMNRQMPRNGFIQISASFKPQQIPPLMPLAAAEAMRQSRTCTQCQCRYSFIGAAFFCPSCGQNSGEQTFQQSMAAIRIGVDQADAIRASLDKDSAETTLRLLREKGCSDVVMAFQRYNEILYAVRRPGEAIPRNLFQRIADGSETWRVAIGKGYDDLISERDLSQLRMYFQQRHLLSHCEGIVDENYVTKSGDTRYKSGQRIVISDGDLLEFADIVERLGRALSTEVKNGS